MKNRSSMRQLHLHGCFALVGRRMRRLRLKLSVAIGDGQCHRQLLVRVNFGRAALSFLAHNLSVRGGGMGVRIAHADIGRGARLGGPPLSC